MSKPGWSIKSDEDDLWNIFTKFWLIARFLVMMNCKPAATKWVSYPHIPLGFCVQVLFFFRKSIPVLIPNSHIAFAIQMRQAPNAIWKGNILSICLHDGLTQNPHKNVTQVGLGFLLLSCTCAQYFKRPRLCLFPSQFSQNTSSYKYCEHGSTQV